MPTTLTSLALLVVLLLPGFVYFTGKERHGTERHISPFRETVTIFTASITSEIVVLTIFAIIRTVRPSITPDVGTLIRGGTTYLRGNYQQFALWGLGLLAASVLLAYVATIPRVRRAMSGLPFVGEYPHSSAVSAWWMLFEHYAAGRQVHVACILDDGSYVGGNLVSFNTSADDAPERELVLGAPIIYRQPGGRREREYLASGVSIAAQRIVTLFVTYVEQVTASSQAEEVAEEAAPALTAAIPSPASDPPVSAAPSPQGPPPAVPAAPRGLPD